MLDAATFVERLLVKARAKLVPDQLPADTFDSRVQRLRPRLVTSVDAIFATRPWGGWLTKTEREKFKGQRVRRRDPWPRDMREVGARLNEQQQLLDLHYHTEIIARGETTRTLRLYRKSPRVELGTVRLDAWEPARARVRGGVSDVARAELRRNLDAAEARGHFPERPLEGTILEVLRGGAWIRARFGNVSTLVRADEVALMETEYEPRDLQRRLLHARLFGEWSPTLDDALRLYRKMTNRNPEDGQLYERGGFVARWPTEHDLVYLEGPLPGEHGVLISRNGFSSRGNAYVQSANARTWTKAVRVVDRLAGVSTQPQKVPHRRVGAPRVPKFGSLSGWLAGLPEVRDRGDAAVSRYVLALAQASPEQLFASAEHDELNSAANALYNLEAKLSSEALAARHALAAQIAFAQTSRSEIVKGYVGIHDPQRVAGWILGRQGPYVVAQPPNLAAARTVEAALARAGFKRRGGGFAALVGPRHGGDGRRLTGAAAVHAEAALALAREAISPSRADLSELGRRWARAETERMAADPRTLGKHKITPADFVRVLAAKRLSASPIRVGSERSFWRGVAEAPHIFI